MSAVFYFWSKLTHSAVRSDPRHSKTAYRVRRETDRSRPRLYAYCIV